MFYLIRQFNGMEEIIFASESELEVRFVMDGKLRSGSYGLFIIREGSPDPE